MKTATIKNMKYYSSGEFDRNKEQGFFDSDGIYICKQFFEEYCPGYKQQKTYDVHFVICEDGMFEIDFARDIWRDVNKKEQFANFKHYKTICYKTTDFLKQHFDIGGYDKKRFDVYFQESK